MATAYPLAARLKRDAMVKNHMAFGPWDTIHESTPPDKAVPAGKRGRPSVRYDAPVNERPKATTRPGKPNQPLPPCGRPSSGRVIRIHAGQSHGFIRDVESREVFFHRSDTTFGTFNKLLVGDKVAFELIEDRVSGPRATAVRLGARAR